jgi:uncharacterized repeat protein (TIGR03803 family)
MHVGLTGAAMNIILGRLTPVILVMMGVGPFARATTFQTLYRFSGGADGGLPTGGLTFDSAGNLYGTASAYGAGGEGTAFELVPPVGTSTDWTYTALYTFCSIVHHCKDGATPETAVAITPKGVLYGTTTDGDLNNGTMFAFHLASSSLKSYKFFKVSSGRNPVAPLFLAANGVLYGSTPIDGPKGGGTIFSFNPDKVGFKNLHAFSGPDGSGPFAGLIADSSGLLYGTTVSGGTGPGGSGTVFTFDPATANLTTLYRFLGAGHADGGAPQAPVTFDSAGMLYGTTSAVGPNNQGTVFKLDPTTLAERQLHVFKNGADGANPALGDGVTFRNGMLYGVTYGSYQYKPYTYGTVYQIDLASGAFTTLYSFSGGADGANPVGGLVADSNGNLYGVTAGGGVAACGTNANAGCGTIFEISP